ncbi:MAG TPA: PilZ domain-containing protein [Aestuariivirgaceae bacterium]|jgi:PilZ domain-containing protein|nr:PilZ domain-containing protein [Aestuariivirgaceae bacterium]
MEDYREYKRFRTLKEGRIIDPQGRTTLDCTIRDMSLTGARVQLVSAINISEHFELLIVREDMIIPARRRWQRGTALGLEFTGPSRRLVGGR